MKQSLPFMCPWCEPAQGFRHVDALNAHTRAEHPEAPRYGAPFTPKQENDAVLAELRTAAAADPLRYEARFLMLFLELAIERHLRTQVAQLGDVTGLVRQLRQTVDRTISEFVLPYVRELRKRNGGV